MVINDLHVFGTCIGPSEANSVLVIDPNRVLPGPVSPEFLKAEARKGQGLKRDGRVQAVQSRSSLVLKLRRERLPGGLRVFPVEYVLGTLVPKRDDQWSGIPSAAGALMLNGKHNTRISFQQAFATVRVYFWCVFLEFPGLRPYFARQQKRNIGGEQRQARTPHFVEALLLCFLRGPLASRRFP